LGGVGAKKDDLKQGVDGYHRSIEG
jgi:hypothetical protein